MPALQRDELAALLLQPVRFDVSKLSARELEQGAAFFGELDKASPTDWQAKYDALADDFAEKIGAYADELNAGEITVAEFRRRMENTIRSTYERAYQYGAAVESEAQAFLNEEDRVAIGRQITDEFEHLRGFVQDIRADELSPAQIAARADMYGEGVRSLYWQGRLGRASTDYLYDYVAQPGACHECEDAAASGPYELEDCPIPGEVCEGYSHCRCEIQRISRSEAEPT